MAYQALARKWRPRNFSEVVGQEHVVKALTHALEYERLHHAYLFTGTRGVGKTTLARILAKAMNCTARAGFDPCGECLHCRELDEGRFVDLIEVDAASRTKVEDTRDLLENVQYAPHQGRFKVYIIDEVHMLSGHSFNALLKTLEEPPPHVKFLLATTDPQKIPVTVLSRCLQFNLKRLTPEQIRGQMEFILQKENIDFDQGAIRALSRAADGSMRDGLSLLDQAIVHGGGELQDGPVNAMLGTVSRKPVFEILDALAHSDASALLGRIAELAEHSPNYADVLQQLLIVLHHAALAQWTPEAIRHDEDAERIIHLAKQLPPEELQLFYQIGLIGQRDLPLAPEPRGGFEMVLLRMLAFQPAGKQSKGPVQDAPRRPHPERKPVEALRSQPPLHKPAAQPSPQDNRQGNPLASAREALNRIPPPVAKTAGNTTSAPGDNPPSRTHAPEYAETVNLRELPAQTRTEAGPPQASQAPPIVDAFPSTDRVRLVEGTTRNGEAADLTRPAPLTAEAVAVKLNPTTLAPIPEGTARPEAKPVEQQPIAPQPPAETVHASLEAWTSLIQEMGLGGITLQLANQCRLSRMEDALVELVMDPKAATLRTEQLEAKLEQALRTHFQRHLKLTIISAASPLETPALRQQRDNEEKQRAAEQEIEQDPTVLALKERLGARVLPGSIKPLD